MPECKKCQSIFPNKIIINNVNHNLQNRQYCLSCSPFGEHNTKKIHQLQQIESDSERYCPRCKQSHLLDEFYSRRGKKHSSVYCKSCTILQTLERQRKFKEYCVQYKGGKCELCDYNKCIAALEFHHKNPQEKDFNISQSRLHKLNKKLLEELDKCLLVCANCHREIHQEYPRKDSNLQPFD